MSKRYIVFFLGVLFAFMSAYAYDVSCGDDYCDSGETCSSCPSDCGCYTGECCVPSSSDALPDGCVHPGVIVGPGEICCDGEEYYGDCCDDNDCDYYEKCSNYNCASAVECGDGYCDPGENCSSCPADCECYNYEVCCNDKCTEPKCSVNWDCDDYDPCTKDVCDDPDTCDAKCSYSDAPDDTSCGWGNQVCCDGTCVTPKCSSNWDCDDGNTNTIDRCKSPGTCSATCDSKECFENTDCASGKICQSYVCVTQSGTIVTDPIEKSTAEGIFKSKGDVTGEWNKITASNFYHKKTDVIKESGTDYRVVATFAHSGSGQEVSLEATINKDTKTLVGSPLLSGNPEKINEAYEQGLTQEQRQQWQQQQQSQQEFWRIFPIVIIVVIIIVALVVIVAVKPKIITTTITSISGGEKGKGTRCSKCGAPLDMDRIRRGNVKCTHCGHIVK